MKKLESISSKKFQLAENELTSIKGGYGGGGGTGTTWDSSYNFYYTYMDSGSYMDQQAYDICRDW
jgi:natural product precursor